jgi:hypothetical protein
VSKALQWGVLTVALGCGSRSDLDRLQREQLAIEPPRALPIEPPRFAPEPPRFAPEPPQTGCVDIVRRYNSVPPTVLLLIDQSQSMAFGFGESTRWEVLREAIIAPETGLLASLDPNARVGLMLYTGQGGFSNPLGCPLLTRLDAQFGNTDAVREAYLDANPMQGGDTPTGESIDGAARALLELSDPAPKYILLATDGEPDTCAQPKPSMGLPLAVASARAAFDRGIRVFVLGVSNGLAAANLQQMTNAGAGKDPALVYGEDADAAPLLSASSDPRQLAEQLKGIIGDVRSCIVDLGTEVGSERSLDGRLVLDGRALANDARSGWTFLDDDTLEIHGAACDTILRDGEQLEVRFPCTGAAPPIR